MHNRREFVKIASSAILAGVAFGKAKPDPLALAFSTLGCPKWDWNKILQFAAQHGYAGIELRGLEGNLDLPSHPIFVADRIEQTIKKIRDSKLKIACVSS